MRASRVVAWLLLFVILTCDGAVKQTSLAQKRGHARHRRALLKWTRCVQTRNERYRGGRVTHAHIHALVLERGSELNLRCFECLHPHELQFIEDAWKPTESFFVQKAGRVFKHIKEKLKFVLGVNETDEEKRWDFTWEHANLSTDKKESSWTTVVDTTKPTTFVGFITQFLKKRRRGQGAPSVGDHFELSVPQVTARAMGWYRCIRRDHSSRYISNFYFVDVVSNMTPTVVFVRGAKDSVVPRKMTQYFYDLKLESFPGVTDWSPCSRCGSLGGESRRLITCTVKVMDNTNDQWLSTNDKVSFMQLFADIPCRSSLLPVKMRAKLWPLNDILQIRKCYSRCRNETFEGSRIIEGFNAFGRRTVVDVVPPGEYRITDKRPLLRKPIIRQTIRILEKDSYKLSCGDVDDGVQWLLNEKYISSETLAVRFPDQRIYINAHNELVIRAVASQDDESFYSCHNPTGEVLRTFSLTVNRAKQRHELIDYVSYSVRFAVFLFVMVLVITVVLNTDAHAEQYRRRSAIKKFKRRFQAVPLTAPSTAVPPSS